MKQLFTVCLLVVMALSGCSPNENSIGDMEKNYEGSYQELVIPIFATVVNNGTNRRATGNNFIRNRGNRGDRAIEVYPGSTYKPDLPEALKEGQVAEILLEEVNRHAEKPKEIYSIETSNLDEATVKIPNEPGKLYRYTIKIKDADGTFKDIRYDPLFTTFDEYNMAINLMKPVYEKGEVVTFFIQNWGPNHISYSENWKVFKQTGEDWEEIWPIPSSEGMMEPLLIEDAWTMKYLEMDDYSELLLPGKGESIVLSHYKLDKGTYKLQVILGSAKHKFILEDGFAVE